MSIGVVALECAKFGGRLALAGAKWALPTVVVIGSVDIAKSFVLPRVFPAPPEGTVPSSTPYWKAGLKVGAIKIGMASLGLAAYASLFALITRMKVGQLSKEAIKTIASHTALNLADGVVYMGSWSILQCMQFNEYIYYSSTENRKVGYWGGYKKYAEGEGRPVVRSRLLEAAVMLYFGLRALRGIAEVAKPGCTLALMQRIWPVRA